MYDTVKNRLRAFLRYKGMTQREFANKVGVSDGYVNAIRMSIKPDKLARVSATFPELDSMWLMTGEGTMLTDGTNPFGMSSEKPAAEWNVLYYPQVEAFMGSTQTLEQPSEKAVKMLVPGYNDCIAINAYGDSMSPLIRSGEMLFLRKWTQQHVEWGKIYLIISREGHLSVKYLMPSAEGDSVLCVSENEGRYPPFSILKEDILHLYVVCGWMHREEI